MTRLVFMIYLSWFGLSLLLFFYCKSSASGSDPGVAQVVNITEDSKEKSNQNNTNESPSPKITEINHEEAEPILFVGPTVAPATPEEDTVYGHLGSHGYSSEAEQSQNQNEVQREPILEDDTKQGEDHLLNNERSPPSESSNRDNLGKDEEPQKEPNSQDTIVHKALSDDINSNDEGTSEEESTKREGEGILESFKVWKEKQPVEAEVETKQKSVEPKIKTDKKVNYASFECGAKITAANPEAESTSSVLNENKDMYMLNPCKAKIWFVIELCEMIRVESIDIANFEMFSSSPESLNVYFSNRYPTREWQHVGTFQAIDERIVQNFPLEEKFYAKFIKVEVLSHFKREHYCPISLIRVFGKSEVEELEESDETSDSDSESQVTENEDPVKVSEKVLPPDPAKLEDETKTPNFLQTAKDAVLGFVNKATETLTGNGVHIENPTEISKTNDSSRNINETVVETSNSEVQKTNSSALNSNSNKSDLVVLLEGDDADEESDSPSNNLTRDFTSDVFCLFNGAFFGNICVNPFDSFWIPYIFKLRTCPKKIYKAKNRLKFVRLDTSFVNKSVLNQGQNLGELKQKFGTGHESITRSDLHFDKNGPVISVPVTPVEVIAKTVVSNIEPTSSSAETVMHEGATALLESTGSTAKVTENFVVGASIDTISSTVSFVDGSNNQLNTDNVVLPGIKINDAFVASRLTQSTCSTSSADSPNLSDLVKPSSPPYIKTDEKILNEKKLDDSGGEVKLDGHIDKSDVDKIIAKVKAGQDVPDSDQDVQEQDPSIKRPTSAEHVDVLVIKLHDDNSKEGKAEHHDAAKDQDTASVDIPASEGGELKSPSIKESNSSVVSENVNPNSEPVQLDKKSLPVPDKLKSENISAAASVQGDASTEDLTKASLLSKASGTEQVKAGKVIVSSPIILLNAEITPSPSKSDVDPSYDKLVSSDSDNACKFKEPNGSCSIGIEVPNGAGNEVRVGSGSSSGSKESVIKKLKGKLKALEANMTLSMLYLEEMSKRYRTALEDQQKHFKSKISRINATANQNKELVQQQQAVINELTQKLINVTEKLENLTTTIQEYEMKIFERYMSIIVVLVVFIMVWTCFSKKSSQRLTLDHRRHSDPVLRCNSVENGGISLSYDKGNHNSVQKLSKNYDETDVITDKLMLNPIPKRKKSKKRVKALDISPSPTTSGTTQISTTAGILFSAGKGLLSGLAGAFSRSRPSRQTRALVDDLEDPVFETTFRRSKSSDLPIIHETEPLNLPERPRSCELLRKGSAERKYQKAKSTEGKHRG